MSLALTAIDWSNFAKHLFEKEKHIYSYIIYVWNIKINIPKNIITIFVRLFDLESSLNLWEYPNFSDLLLWSWLNWKNSITNEKFLKNFSTSRVFDSSQESIRL